MADKPKFGGIKVTFRPANSPNSEFRNKPGEIIAHGMCVCGKTKAECNAEWDEKLGVRGHTADSQSGVSEYERNRMNIADAIVRGLDPYCFKATALVEGYVPHWTPHRPAGSFSVPTQYHEPAEAPHDKGTPNPRDNARGGTRGNRRGGTHSKSIRRKR